MPTMLDPKEPEIFIEFKIVYLTEQVNLDPRAKRAVEKGLTVRLVYAKNAEDAILRLRERSDSGDPLVGPIIEIADVVRTGNDSTMLVLPREWAGGVFAKSLAHSN